MIQIEKENLEKKDYNKNIDSSILAVASLFECPFSLDWLAELTGKRITTLISNLEQANQEGILRNERPGVYSFRQSKTRNQLMAEIDPWEKRCLCEKISEILLRDSSNSKEISSETLARHLLKTKNSTEGCRYLINAGDTQLQNYNQEMAFKCYVKVLTDLSDKSGDNIDRLYVETAIKFSKISTAKQDTDKVLNILNSALNRARLKGDKRSESLLEMHTAKNEWLKAKYDSALSHFESGWNLAKELNDNKLSLVASTFSTFFLFWQGRFKEATENYEKSVPDIESFPKDRFPLLAAITVGYCYAQTGQITQGLGMLYSIRNYCIEKGDMTLAAYASGNIGEILLSIRRMDEAIYYLTLSEKEAQKSNNKWVLITVQLFLAYSYYLKGKKQVCLKHLKTYLDESRQVKTTVNPYPYLISLALAMKKGEITSFGELSINTMVRRYIRGRNIYMKGIGYRYKAFLQMEEKEDSKKIIQSFQQSIRWLKESGQSIELAYSRLELSRFMLSIGDKEEACKLAESSAKLLSNHNEDLIPDDLFQLIETRPKKESLLKEIMSLGQEMVTINDHKDLVQYIISTVNRITGAERGAIFLWSKDKSALQLRGSKNLTAEQIEHQEFRSSYELIEEVARTGKGCIKNCDNNDFEFNYSCQPFRSRICVPMVLRNNVMGALYHENRLLNSAFKESDLEILSYFAALAAFALDNVQAYREIRRLNDNLRKERQYYHEEYSKATNLSGIVGKSSSIQKVIGKIAQVAETDATVLIQGETGVGKELVARAVHNLSSRKENSFISVDCSALPDNLIPSELFGHEKGAFTGAQKKRIGRFELAHKGTIFLDEIGNISTEIQIRLLRILQTKKFERVGGTETLHSNFRLIAATNKNLEGLVESGTFRADLFYRLNIFPIYVPPLRERKEDIPLLAEHFRRIYAKKMGKEIEGISEKDMEKLKQYSFPGNIRELQNIIERACILSTGKRLKLPEFETKDPSDEKRPPISLKENEKRHIIWALNQTGWKIRGRGGAAELLEIHPSTLAFRMKKLGIERPNNN